jgi:hypothetical protein
MVTVEDDRPGRAGDDRLVIVEDFTALSVGSDVPCEGPVEACPRCGRSGVHHEEPDGTSYVHVQATKVLSDGMLVEPRDCCRLSSASGQ